MLVLLLQRPHAKSKDKDHVHHLAHHLSLWNQGDIDSLVSEGRVLQSQLSKFHKTKLTSDASSTAHKFSQLMMNGRVKDALRLLSSDCDGGIATLYELKCYGITHQKTSR